MDQFPCNQKTSKILAHYSTTSDGVKMDHFLCTNQKTRKILAEILLLAQSHMYLSRKGVKMDQFPSNQKNSRFLAVL